MSTALIVGDDPGMREVLSRWLTAAGHETAEAVDAESALEILNVGESDVLLCDVTMLGRGGLWLVERARAEHPAVAMVLATGVDNLLPSITPAATSWTV